MKRKLVVISIDAMSKLDFEFIRELEPFKSFIEEGSYCENVMGVFPTLNYPSHASMLSSNNPDRHSITRNYKLLDLDDLNKREDIFRKDIKGKIFYDYLEEKKYRNSSYFYPCLTGENRGYILPFIDKTYTNIKKELKKNRKSIFSNDAPLISVLNTDNDSEQDEFVLKDLKRILKSNKTDTFFINFTELYNKRKRFGFSGSHVEEAYQSISSKIIEIEELFRLEKDFEETTIVINSNHSGKNAKNVIHLNTLFKEQELLFDRDGMILDITEAYASCNGGSSQIIIKDKLNIPQVFELLLNFRDLGYIKEIYTRHEIFKKYSLDGDFEFIVIANENYQFSEEVADEHITVLNEDDVNIYVDGYLPDDNQVKTLFFIRGPRIKKGFYLQSSNLVDQAVTFAKLLDTHMPSVDGHIIDEIIAV